MAFPYLGLSFPNMGTKMRSRKWVRLTIVPPTEEGRAAFTETLTCFITLNSYKSFLSTIFQAIKSTFGGTISDTPKSRKPYKI